MQANLERVARKFLENPTDFSQLQKLDITVGLLQSLPFHVNLWKVQNICYEILQSTYPALRSKATQGDDTAREWSSYFDTLAEKLSLHLG